ncbi:hypothetical protein NE237_011251 [Protea cynaroides]|uniref:Transposase (putative) gypsy type domain-containing protein n=1 Tax=Protea cynaroides TaxID=273540 RepID=A0A9Q0JY35_9MAGN|nr:hypothetical protein NE237_011251 [Protea cynaroides]
MEIAIPSPTEVEVTGIENKLSKEMLNNLLAMFLINENYYTRIPSEGETACKPHRTEMCVYTKFLWSGFKLPIFPETMKILKYYSLTPAQVQANSWSMILAFNVYFHKLKKEPYVDLFKRIHMLNKAKLFNKEILKSGWYFFNKRPNEFDILSKK